MTILENIAFGEKILDINYEKVINACKAARIYDFIKNSEKGFYSTVGERGIKISGGQLQRIAIARALYKNPDILIFDEATSALDSETEKKVMRNILRDYKGSTLIMVAHRLTTLNNCDRLITFKDGRITK